jgi:hypothetical protein
MMKLKNQVAQINQQSFTHLTTNTLKLKNLSLLTQNCFCKTGNRIVDTEEGDEEQQWVTISIFFPLSFFLSLFLNVFHETQFLKEINKKMQNTNNNNNNNNKTGDRSIKVTGLSR